MPKLSEVFKLREDLDIKKLHEPQDFAVESEEFAVEVNAQLKMLTHFAQDKGLKNLEAAIVAAQEKFTALEQALAACEGQMGAEERLESAPPTTFKKI